MAYFALFYEAVNDFIARRGAYRDEHLQLACEAHARGELVLAGALADPADGALLIFQGESPAVAEAFARQDPYVKNALITNWTVRTGPWWWATSRASLRPKRRRRSRPEMIARLWSARTTPALSDSYLQHFTESVRPDWGASRASWCDGQYAPAPGSVEILVTTYWVSFAAIDAFAGADREAAVVAAEAAALLTDYDRRVRHYEVAIAESPQPLRANRCSAQLSLWTSPERSGQRP